MKIFPIYCFVFLWFNPMIGTYGQAPDTDFSPGIIITNDDDTISGFILWKDQAFNAKKCVFRNTLETTEKSYNTNELKAYAIPGKKYFHSSLVRGLTEEQVFLECIVLGRLSLFFYKDRYFVKIQDEIKELIISEQDVTQDGKVYRGKRFEYKELLQKNMFDCPNSLKELETTTLNKKSLKRLFVNYLECVEVESILYESTALKTMVRFGFGVGLVASNLNLSYGGGARLTYIEGVKIQKELSVSPSFIIEFSRPELSDRFQIRTGLTLYTLKHQIYDENPTTNLINELSIETSRIEVPVLFKYYLLKQNIGLYILGGAGFDTFIKWDDLEVVSTVSPGAVLRESMDVLDHRQSFINFMAGIGIDFPLGKQTLRIEGIVGKGPGLMEVNSSISGSVNSLSVSGSILF